MQKLEIPPGTDFNDLPDSGAVISEEQADPVAELLDRYRLDYSQPLPPPPVALEIDGATFGTLGNFSLVIGKAKSKKTFLVTLAMAAAIGGEMAGLVGRLPECKRRVIFVDTEQGEYHVNKAARRVMRLVGADTPPKNFEVFHLRGADTRTRRTVIAALIENTPDLGLLIIDGIRDVVTSINDEEQATSITNDLLRWTEQQQIHIITVLHQNKGDTNARGHLGTEMINKAEQVVSVTVEPDNKEVSRVVSEFSRDKFFEPFAFMVNEQGLPERVTGWRPKASDRPKNEKYDPGEIADQQHFVVLSLVQQKAEKANYSEMVKQIRYAVSDKIQTIGKTKAENYFTWYKNNGYLIPKGKPGTKSAFFEVDLSLFTYLTTLPP